MRNALVGLVVVALVGCGGDPDTTTTITLGQGAESPVAAIEELRSALIAGDFDKAGALSVPNQATLASLAEGATTGQVADALGGGDAAIAANFWGGFAQGAGEVFIGDIAIEDLGTAEESGVEFFLVGVTPPEGVERIIVTREVEGQRIDLFASFGAVLADRMSGPVELMLGASSEDSRATLAALQDVVPSLLLAARDESLSPESAQSILQLVELITRVG
ncbi:MAG: hypothetical protein ACRDZM_01475 [Acidimicrobiia bacterium]